MTKQTINTGTSELAGDGESIRSAFTKINENFDEVYGSTSELSADIVDTNARIDSLVIPSDLEDLTDNTGLLFSKDYQDLNNKPDIPADVSDLTDTEGLLGGGTGLPTVTIPAEAGSTYKGLQVSYGMIHSNGNSSELNVNKIVIHKPAVSTVAIDPTSSQDYFQVSGIADSDILAMFVVYGDTNGPKPLSTLQAFAEAVIDFVILDSSIPGQYNTVDEMKSEFYNNYQILASAAGGLYTNFQFFQTNVNTIDGTTTVREGSGAIFEISDLGDGTYNPAGILNNGTNYLPGHKIKVLGTDLGGATPDNDCIITVDSISEGGLIFQWSVSGTAAGTEPALYSPVSGTNYNVGSGFTVASVSTNDGTLQVSLNSIGFNYVVGDVITLTGDKLQNGVTPDNDITITVSYVDGLGQANSSTVTGTLPEIWPENNIGDGGEDQYDTANYISTNFADSIDYNLGETVVEGTAFGIGSTYSFVYDTAMFGVFATNANVEYIRTSGNSGADGSSATEAGHIYGPDTAAQTFTNAVTHINLIGDPYAGPIVSFTHTDYGDEIDILIPDDGNQGGIGITRSGNGNGIYNPYREEGWSNGISPSGTLWNTDGWADLTDAETREYLPLYEAFGSGGLGNKIVGAECLMWLPDNGKYYAVKFTQWTQNNQGGGFAYTRRELDLNSLQQGIRFTDGTVLKSAEGIGRVKLESTGSRRIEEVYGYKSVTLTPRITTTPGTTTSVGSNDGNTWQFNIVANDELLGYYNGNVEYSVEVSLDQNTWLSAYIGGSGGGNLQIVLNNGLTLSVAAGTTVYYRISTGNTPVVWWDAADLPGGRSNFRGAIIKYHAYDTNAGTMIGTIYTVDDSGDENVSHTEVFSGGGDGDTIILWEQTQEGQLKFRRTNGEGTTIKIQWSATVFYGSEFWD